MSQATRCPSCGTVFRVVQDQLKVSDGWVRCGRCSEVFDASRTLFDLDSAARGAAAARLQRMAAPADRSGWAGARAANDEPPPRAAARMRSAMPPLSPAPGPSTPAAAGSAPPEPAVQAAPAEAPPEPGSAGATSIDAAPPQTAPPEPAPPTPAIAAADPAARTADRGSSATTTTAATEGSAPVPPSTEPAVETPEVRPPGAAPASDVSETAVDATASAAVDIAQASADDAKPAGMAVATSEPVADAEPMPDFVLRAQRAERWRRPPVRATMAVLALALAALLAAQMGLHYGDSLAASWPASRPWLQRACNLLGCRIEPPRRIDSLSLDSSALLRVEGSNLYRLQLVLRNRSTTAVRMPAIDLSLTDSRGQTVLRRVLDAAELGNAADSLPPMGETALQAALDPGERGIAGYSVELFYP